MVDSILQTSNAARLAAAAALLLAITAGSVPAAGLERERLLLDHGWRFRVGDAPDAGEKFTYPEVSFLEKTRVECVPRKLRIQYPRVIYHVMYAPLSETLY